MYECQYLMMSSFPACQWPFYISRAPKAGITSKDYAGYAETLAAESCRLFRDNVVEMETCSLSDLGWVILSRGFAQY